MVDDDYGTVRRGAPGMIEFPCGVERLPNGNTLIADAGDELGFGSEVVEVDPLGNIVWDYVGELNFVHSARPLRNGNILMADTTNDRVIEVTRGRQVVFSSDDCGEGTGTLGDGTHLRYPNDARELPDGSLLVCDRNNDRCLILERGGQVRWQFSQGLVRPHNARPLDNGNFLICDSDSNRILEVTPEKKIVWCYGDGSPETLNWPRSAVRLEDGNTVICDSRNARVIEVTALGEMVWEYRVNYLAKFYEVQVLPNDNLLVSDQQHHQVIEVDRAGNYRWLHRNYHMLGPIQSKLVNGSFREREPDGTPRYWSLANRHSEGGGRIIWDETNRPYPCPGLEFDRPGLLYLQQTVAVKAGRRYRLAARVRTEGVEGSASFMMCFLDKYGGQLYDMADIPKGDLYTGDNDWTLDTVEAAAPEDATCAELRLYINGPGKAWMKEVIFHS